MSTTSNQLRICQIGCGNWGKNILRDLKLLGCHVTVLARTETSRQAAKQLQADAIINSIESLSHVDGFVIVTPTNTHARIIKQIAHFNLPIFVEKPLTNSALAAQEVVDLIGDKLFVMDKWRYHNGIKKLRQIAQEQMLGPVQGILTHRFSWGNPHYTDVDAIWILLPHDLSILLEILGYIPEPKIAVGSIWPEEATSLHAILGEQPWAQVSVSSIRYPFEREIRLECLNGVAVLKDGYSDSIEIFRRDQWNKEPVIEKISFANEMPLYKELETFINYLRGGPKPVSSAQEGLEIVRMVEKLRSMASINQNNNKNPFENLQKDYA